ncbi:MAG TPA: DUF3341 domain-containing protein [Candidatus Binatia bacterium]|nr:DUF3341 domain-containing protein [Candidatus Binatia bacterium]
MAQRLPIHGLMAEFSNPVEFVAAIEAVRHEGYTRFDAYSPLPIEEAAEAMGLHGSVLPKLVLLGGIAGGLFGYGLAYWTSVIDYPLNVGGRPLHSWPAFIPVIFECIILFAALTTIFGMLGLNKLPQPYHPVFNVKRFALASKDRFFVCIEASDPKFHIDDTWRFLLRLEPRQVSEVES